jgi:hypothetical protein
MMRYVKLKENLVIISALLLSIAIMPLAAWAEQDKEEAQLSQAANKSMVMLDAPSRFFASSVTATRVDLRWEYDNSKDPELLGFVIYRRRANSSKWHAIILDNPKARGYCDRNLKPHTKYYYRVCAYKAKGILGSFRSISTLTLPIYPRYIFKEIVREPSINIKQDI